MAPGLSCLCLKDKSGKCVCVCVCVCARGLFVLTRRQMNEEEVNQETVFGQRLSDRSVQQLDGLFASEAFFSLGQRFYVAVETVCHIKRFSAETRRLKKNLPDFFIHRFANFVQPRNIFWGHFSRISPNFINIYILSPNGQFK